MDWFLYDSDFRHERIKLYFLGFFMYKGPFLHILDPAHNF